MGPLGDPGDPREQRFYEEASFPLRIGAFHGRTLCLAESCHAKEVASAPHKNTAKPLEMGRAPIQKITPA